MSISVKRVLCLLLGLLCFGFTLPSCSTIPNKKIEELLVRKGFGKRAEGDAQVEDYATTGSQIQFWIDPILLRQEKYFDLQVLVSGPQAVGVDGQIYIPGYGTTYVLGLTEERIASLISERLSAIFESTIPVEARILDSPKYFYMFGETTPGARPFVGDLTVLEVFATNPILPLANVGKIRLVRPDPETPLVVSINVRDMVLYGITTYNLNIKENDIIYVPPTFFGSVSRFIERLTSPLTTLVAATFQASSIRYQYRVLTGERDFNFYGNPYLF
ncbi:MAG: hypothetical protein KDC95_21855 [Planctomycetes bacterium]|nr:hypothetical protein [Planctomycetota bacterium]